MYLSPELNLDVSDMSIERARRFPTGNSARIFRMLRLKTACRLMVSQMMNARFELAILKECHETEKKKGSTP